MNLAFNNSNQADNIFVIKAVSGNKVSYVIPNIPAINSEKALERCRKEFVDCAPVRFKMANGNVVGYNSGTKKVLDFIQFKKVPEGCQVIQGPNEFAEAVFAIFKEKSDDKFFNPFN
ncbi:MAG: hypothetical protein MJ244_03055 [Clostridia bacterium]|nr:hypothetical protein [Clostridia bacterium]